MGTINPSKKKDYAKKTRIDVNEPLQVAYWTERFGVSSRELIAAILAAGPSAKNVENYLKERKAKQP
jgi:Protein of unknown function (DUF3606)